MGAHEEIGGPEVALLEAIAEAATPGPWVTRRGTCEVFSLAGGHLLAVTHTQFPDRPRALHEEDARFIAALNPEMVRRLIATVYRLQADVARLEAELAEARPDQGVAQPTEPLSPG